MPVEEWSEFYKSLIKTTYGTDSKSKILRQTHPYKLFKIKEINVEIPIAYTNNTGKKDNSWFNKAVLKWEEDLEFLSGYNHNHSVVYRIRNLIY